MAKTVFKRCSKCNRVKSKAAYYACRRYKDGVRPECRRCAMKRQKDYIKRNPEKHATWQRTAKLHRYGIDRRRYDELIEEQSGLCAICWTKPGVCVDHDHDTGKVRGLLCHKCNLALGFLYENEDAAIHLLTYIRERC